MQPPLSVIGQRSRSAIRPFRLHRPATVDEAAALRAELGTDAAYMAGGLDLVGRMKDGLAPGHVIHLGRVAALSAVQSGEDGLELGAALTHAEASALPALQRRHPALAAAWRDIGHPRVQCRGTLGGNLCAGHSHHDLAPMLMALDARVRVRRSDLTSVDVPLGALARTPGLLLAVRLHGSWRLRVDRSLRPVVTLALGIEEAEGHVVAARVAVGCAYAEALAWPLALPKPLSARELAAGAQALAADFTAALPAPLHDAQAGSAYRRRMIGLLLRRLLQREGEAA